MKPTHWTQRLLPVTLLLSAWLCTGAPATVVATPYDAKRSADRAVQIAIQSRTRVEQNGKRLKASSQALFKDFADRTVKLQQLIDTRQQLEQAGLLDKNDPEGNARRAHINGKILMEVGALKQTCDSHLEGLLASLKSFDDAVSRSLVDSQATRSMNSNYELALDQYLKQEKDRFEDASADAHDALNAYQDAVNDRDKERLLRRYNRAKRRLIKVAQRRKLYEARIKTAMVNQQITGLIREKIRKEGADIPSRFRMVLSDLYTTFSKVTPIAEMGGTGSPELLSNVGFSNVQEIRQTLQIVDGAIVKLGGVMDDMVDDVLAGLSEVQVVNDAEVTAESLSMEEEMEFLSRQRAAWNS